MKSPLIPYRVTLQSDAGKHRTVTTDATPKAAAMRVCAAYGAPWPTAVVKVEPVRPTLRQLVNRVSAGNDRHFFELSTMRFFGDTMRNYKVSGPVDVRHEPTGEIVQCWELERKAPVKAGLIESAFFAIDDYRRIFKPLR